MAEALRFGAVEIRPVERQVMVEGRAAALGSRAFDVLVALAERRDRVVTKNELLDLAWPGLVVEENNLQAQVSALRRLLGPQAIATIPGRGYRFTMAHGGEPPEPPPGMDPGNTPRGPSPVERRGLPRLASPLIGRDDELIALDRLLEQHRLVTLAGAAGIGKTSVAIAAAEDRLERMRDGVIWAELAPIRDPALVPSAIAKALQVQVAPGADVTVPLMAALRTLEALLVIDTAEHLLEAVAQMVDAIVTQAPGITILVTSRSALKLKHERLVRLAPLGVPDPGMHLEEARTFGAVALLEERARASNPRFELTEDSVAQAIEVCRHLDGIALAIELAAARVPLLGMRGLAERIGQRFRLLASSSPLVPTRQQTLLAAMDWSHDLLSPEEQKVFRRLGVFAGDFSVELATKVARDESLDDWAVIDALGALVDVSLVEVDAAVVPRYRLLESARAYALLKMSEEETHATNRALATTLLAMFEVAERESWWRVEADWVAVYGAELENMRAALDWSMEHDRALAMALLGSSRFLHSAHSLDFELRQRCESFDAGPHVTVPVRVEADYCHALAWTLRLARRSRTAGFALRAAELYRELGDDMMRYVALSKAALTQDPEQVPATAAQMKALERPGWPARVKYAGATTEAFLVYRAGQSGVDALFEQSLAYARECGSDNLVRRMLGNIADRALSQGDVDKAVRAGRELVVNTPTRHYHALIVRGNLANALLQAGDVEHARDALEGYIELSRLMRWDTFPVFAPVLGLFAAREGRYESAARILGHARRWASEVGKPEFNEQRALDLAMEAVNRHLDAAAVERLMLEGERLDEEAVCAHALERAAPRAPADPPTTPSPRKISAGTPGAARR